MVNTRFHGESAPKEVKSESESTKGRKTFLGKNRANPKKSVTPRIPFKNKWRKGIFEIRRSFPPTEEKVKMYKIRAIRKIPG